MQDLMIDLENKPGALATMGEALGRAGISIEGGGAWVIDGRGAAHFLVADGAAGRHALEAAGIRVVAVRDVLVQRLHQGVPGQLGKLSRRMAEAGVNIEVLYSDHEHQLILIVDDLKKGCAVSEAWMREHTAAQASSAAAAKRHTYHTHVEWTGNDGEGTRTYRSYRRDHTISVAGKPPLLASSDHAFRGDPGRHSPEDLLVASLASCHMLWYLHLCAVNNIVVLGYRDDAIGCMDEAADGSGTFARVTLRPTVKISANSDPEKARALHADAHRFCFIANSVKFPVEHEPAIIVAH